MIKSRSNLISIACISVACLFSIYEYKNGHKNKLLIAQNQNTQVVSSDDVSDLHQINALNEENNDEDFSNVAIPIGSTAAKTDVPTLQHALEQTEKVSETPKQKLLKVVKGDTFASILKNNGLSSKEIEQIISSLKSIYNTKSLAVGQTINLNFDESAKLSNLNLRIDDINALVLKRESNGAFKAKIEKEPTELVLRRAHGRVHTSFYSTCINNKIPKTVVKQTIASLAFIMNFQHGIKRGDSFEILYDERVNSQGKTVEVGNIRYIGFMAGNVYHRIYRFEGNGHVGYYDYKGNGINRGLLQTPLDSRKMRITSGFGNRLHPIKGYRHDHKGVDFGAPTGTEIKAAGAGVIVKLGYNGGYGNFIKIRHGQGFETAYGHMSRYAKNLRIGSKVAQNQVIGYVGSTGDATGPHLHFEVLKNGVHMNPMRVKQMPAVKLTGHQLKKFNQVKNQLQTHIVGLSPANNSLVNLASADIQFKNANTSSVG